MKKIKVFECFAGIGAQHKALSNLKKTTSIDFEIIGISEWYISAIIAYAQIHHKNELEQIKEPSMEEMMDFLSQKNFVFSSDSKKPISNIKRLGKENISNLYKACIVSKNFGSITEIKGETLPNIDILTYSFPCQAISLQGKQLGIEKGSGTTSSLLWEIERILNELNDLNKLPSILLMENVKALFSEKHIKGYNEWKNFLNEIGYETFDTILNSQDFGSIQNRERAFAISIKKELIQKPFQITEYRNERTGNIQNILLDKTTKIDQKYYKNNLIEKINFDKKSKKSSGIVSTLFENYTTFQSENILYFPEGCSPTITASGANSHIKVYLKETNEIRYLTPLEIWRTMGFEDIDFSLANEKIKSDIVFYRLAGNSISVEVLESLFKDVLNVLLY